MVELFNFSPAAPILRTFMQNLITFCSQPEAASDVISGTLVRPIVVDKYLKFHDPSLNILKKLHPRPSETVFSTFFRYITSDQK